MVVIDVKIVVPEVHVDATSEYGLNEKAYIALSHALGNAGIGEVLDCRRVQPTHA